MEGIAKVLAGPLAWLVLLLIVAAGSARGREVESSRHPESRITGLLRVLPTSPGCFDTIAYSRR